MAAMIDPERRVTRTGSAADDHLGRDGQHLQRKRLILHDVDLAAALLPAGLERKFDLLGQQLRRRSIRLVAALPPRFA